GFATTGAFNGQVGVIVVNLATGAAAGEPYLAYAPTNANTLLVPVVASDVGVTAANPRFSYVIQSFDIVGALGSDSIPTPASFHAAAGVSERTASIAPPRTGLPPAPGGRRGSSLTRLDPSLDVHVAADAPLESRERIVEQHRHEPSHQAPLEDEGVVVGEEPRDDDLAEPLGGHRRADGRGADVDDERESDPLEDERHRQRQLHGPQPLTRAHAHAGSRFEDLRRDCFQPRDGVLEDRQ